MAQRGREPVEEEEEEEEGVGNTVEQDQEHTVTRERTLPPSCREGEVGGCWEEQNSFPDILLFYHFALKAETICFP